MFKTIKQHHHAIKVAVIILLVLAGIFVLHGLGLSAGGFVALSIGIGAVVFIHDLFCRDTSFGAALATFGFFLLVTYAMFHVALIPLIIVTVFVALVVVHLRYATRL